MDQMIIELDNGVKVTVDVGPPDPHLHFCWKSKPVIFMVGRRTSMANIVYIRMITFTWRWPFIDNVSNFIDRNMGGEDANAS